MRDSGKPLKRHSVKNHMTMMPSNYLTKGFDERDFIELATIIDQAKTTQLNALNQFINTH
jgi:hypothetical protein